MPTPLPATDRYIAPGVAKVYFFTVCANIAAPSRAEMEAGTDFTKEIATATGWEVTADRVTSPDLGGKFTPRSTGRVHPGDSQHAFYASADTNDIRSVLSRGDKGFVMILDGGDVPGQLARVFAVEVASVTPTLDAAGTENSRIMVNYAVSDVAEQVTIPALP